MSTPTDCPHCGAYLRNILTEGSHSYDCGTRVLLDTKTRSPQCFSREIEILNRKLEDGDRECIATPVNWKEVAEKWQWVADNHKSIIGALLSRYDSETGMIDVRPEPSCPLCTHGVTPARHDKGPCAYHRALVIVAPTPSSAKPTNED